MVQKLEEKFETLGRLRHHSSFGERKKETFPNHAGTCHCFFLLCGTGNEVVMEAGEVHLDLDIPHLARHLPGGLHCFERKSRQFAQAGIISTYGCHPEDGNLVP